MAGEGFTEHFRLGVVSVVHERQDGDRMNLRIALGGLVGKTHAPQEVEIAGLGVQMLVCRIDFQEQ